MLCPNCYGDIKTDETISGLKANYRQKKCTGCGFKFYTKEAVVEPDECESMFKEWSRERSRRARAKKKGVSYDFQFADGRQNKPEPKRPTSPLF